MPKAKPKIGLDCVECGARFEVQPYREKTAKTCSTRCRQSHSARFSGEPQRYRGNRKTYTKWHGRHMHRVAAERKLGRPLVKGEVVHHIDGDKFNNEASNLLVTTQSEHCKLHGFGGISGTAKLPN
jgi:hypothetical protein